MALCATEKFVTDDHIADLPFVAVMGAGTIEVLIQPFEQSLGLFLVDAAKAIRPPNVEKGLQEIRNAKKSATPC